jgi:hypothetical protein
MHAIEADAKSRRSPHTSRDEGYRRTRLNKHGTHKFQMIIRFYSSKSLLRSAWHRVDFAAWMDVRLNSLEQKKAINSARSL